MRRAMLVRGLTVAIVLIAVAPARADVVDDCNQQPDRDLRISACTEILRSGRFEGTPATVAAVLVNRGAAYWDLGQSELGAADFETAARFDPNNAMAHNNRGIARHRLGQLAAAIEDFDQAIRIDPDSVIARNNRGASRREVGDLPGAIEDLDRAIQNDPDCANAYNNRAQVHFDLGDHARSLQDYDRAMQLAPDVAETYNGRGNVHCRAGNVEAALADWDRAIELAPGMVGRGQKWMREQGFYDGPVDGRPNLDWRAAGRAWAEAGCPGL